MRYTTAVGTTTEVRPRLFGKSTVCCACGFNQTVATDKADELANRHAGSCRRVPSKPVYGRGANATSRR